MKDYDEIENWDNKGELFEAFENLMQVAVKQNIPIICHIAIQANMHGYRLTGGMNERAEEGTLNKGWVPPSFMDMYSIVNLDDEGKQFVSDAIRMAMSNHAKNEAQALTAQLEKEVSHARKDN